MLAVTLQELLVIYGLPLAAAAALWLLASAWVFVLARVSRAAVRRDLEHRLEAQRAKRSGRGKRLTYSYVALSLLGDNCVQATVLHRLAAFLIRRRASALARVVHGVSKMVTNVDISPYARIEPGLFLYHGLGTVIGKGTYIGRDVLVCQNVTTGGGPTIGDSVKLWAGAKVIGRVSIGDYAEIGANGVVVADIPPNMIAVGVPATKLIPKPIANISDVDQAARARARS